MRIRYLAVADLEMTAAAEYYEQQRPGLGAAFIDELRRQKAELLNIRVRGRRIRMSRAVVS